MAETKSKRRKLSAASVSASSPMRLLREAERSTVCREGFETLSRDKELWIIRVPREVSVSLCGLSTDFPVILSRCRNIVDILA